MILKKIITRWSVLWSQDDDDVTDGHVDDDDDDDDDDGVDVDVDDDDHQVFSPTGALLSRWGVRGRGPGQLQRPTGIAVMKVHIIIIIIVIIVWQTLILFHAIDKWKTF